MRLPRTETTLAAVLLLSAAPFALAAPPPGTSPTPNTPGVTPPETTPSTTNPNMTPNSGAATATGSSSTGSSSMSSSGWSHNRTRLRSAEHVPTADIDAAKSAKVSLTDAINAAQVQDHGNVVSARFELRQGKPEYLIRAFDGKSGQEWVGHVDASTGKLIGQGETVPLSRLPKEDQQELTASQNSGSTLAQAVQTAEQQRGGKALAAGLSARQGKVTYRTQLLQSNGRTQMAMVNPQSGQVSSYR